MTADDEILADLVELRDDPDMDWRAVTWTGKTQTGANAYSPSTGRATDDTVASPPTVPLLGMAVASAYLVGQNLAEAGDTMGLIVNEGLTFTPKQGDKVTIDGQSHKVVRLDRLAPIKATLGYIPHFRRG